MYMTTSIKVGFVVNKINRETAKPFVEQHHYTHTLGKASLICGLFWGEYLLGVITFGQVSGRLLAQSIWEGGNQKNTFEFLRMCVLDKCECPRTFFISQAIKILRQEHPEIKCLVSFADQTEGHTGIVYQAASWIYCGKTKKKYHYIKDGKRVNKRIPWDAAKRCGMKEKEYAKKHGYEKVEELPKLRYVFPLRKIRLKQKALKYPKFLSDNT